MATSRDGDRDQGVVSCQKSGWPTVDGGGPAVLERVRHHQVPHPGGIHADPNDVARVLEHLESGLEAGP
jgi:hypothetical protein